MEISEPCLRNEHNGRKCGKPNSPFDSLLVELRTNSQHRFASSPVHGFSIVVVVEISVAIDGDDRARMTANDMNTFHVSQVDFRLMATDFFSANDLDYGSSSEKGSSIVKG
jgi:hypothetical protein